MQHWISYPTLALSVIGLGLCYLGLLCLYRLFLHPLAKFPGPRLAAISNSYEFYYDVIQQGKFTEHIQKLHEIYGKSYSPIVDHTDRKNRPSKLTGWTRTDHSNHTIRTTRRWSRILWHIIWTFRPSWQVYILLRPIWLCIRHFLNIRPRYPPDETKSLEPVVFCEAHLWLSACHPCKNTKVVWKIGRISERRSSLAA